MTETILLIALIIATITDVKTKTIPLPLFPIVTVIAVIEKLVLNVSLIPSLISSISLSIIFVILAITSKGGGGDIIMFFCIGFVLGLKDSFTLLYILCAVYIFALVIYMLYGKIRRKKSFKEIAKTQIPLAPFVLTAYSVLLVANLWR